VSLYGRAVGLQSSAQGEAARSSSWREGVFHAAALQAGHGPLWVCEGAFDALALLAAGVSRVVAIFGVQGWRWDWAREVRELVFALDADVPGSSSGASSPARRRCGEARRRAAARAYGGQKDVNEGGSLGPLRWVRGSHQQRRQGLGSCPGDLHEAWEERVAIMVAEVTPPHRRACLAGRGSRGTRRHRGLPRWP